MATYEVGNNDGRLLKKRTTMSLEEALEVAENGDLIKIKEDSYLKQETKIVISKSIILLGIATTSEEGQTLPTIGTNIVVDNNAEVTLSRIHLYAKDEPCLLVKDGASVATNEVLMECNRTKEGEPYTVISAKDQAEVNLHKTTIVINSNENVLNKILLENATCIMDKCTINSNIVMNNSYLKCNNSKISKLKSNKNHTIFVDKESEIEIKNSEIKGSINLTDESKARLDGISIVCEQEKWNGLRVLSQSSIIANNIVVENTASEGKNYPVVYIEDSNFELANCTIKPSMICDGNYTVGLKNSRGFIKNSTIEARLHIINSSLQCTDSEVVYNDNNVFFITDNSEVEITSTTVEGGKIEEKTSYPCVKAIKSKIKIIGSTIFQPNYHSAIEIKDSFLELDKFFASSATIIGSEVIIGEAEFAESLSVMNKSKISATCIVIHGEENGKINLYINQESELIADALGFVNLSSPNFKAERNANFYIKNIAMIKCDEEGEVCVDEDDAALLEKYEAGVEYFGEEVKPQA